MIEFWGGGKSFKDFRLVFVMADSDALKCCNAC